MSNALQYALRRHGTQQGGNDIFRKLLAMDDKLAAAGFPRISAFWLKRLEAFFKSGKIRFVARIGRRGGKSSTMCRVAVALVLYGNFRIPPGDTGVFAFVSVDRKEAKQRLVTIRTILEALGVRHRPTAEEIHVIGMPRAFKVYTCSFRTSVGFTGIGLVCDEVSRWRDDDTGSNPATEVFRSMRPTMKTQRKYGACEFLISSPWSTLDAHHDAFEKGDNKLQMVVHAPTWVANPTVTEKECREEEDDEEAFQREYAAIPMRSGVQAFFDAISIDAAIQHGWNATPAASLRGLDRLTAGADFGFRSDFSCLWVSAIRGGVYHCCNYLVIKPPVNQPLSPSETVSRFAAMVKQYGIEGVMADNHYREAISEYLAKSNLLLFSAPGGNDGNTTAFIRARTLMNQGKLLIPDDKQLIRDLKEVRQRPLSGARIAVMLPRRSGGGHADLVSALVLAVYQRQGREVPVKRSQMETDEHGWTAQDYKEADDYATQLERLDNPGYDPDDPDFLAGADL